MKKFISILSVLLLSSAIFGLSESNILLEAENCTIEGSLLLPDGDGPFKVALIIAGSGPTDRDGNNVQMKNNSLKMVAQGLAENGIASLRYDKRGVGKSIMPGMMEINLRFNHYFEDAEKWIELLVKDSRFSHVYVVGHSEGSLLGMIAAQNQDVAGFISLAGAGDAAGVILRRQLAEQPPQVLEESLPIIEKLENGETVDSVPSLIAALFRPSVQPYMISWFKYNPGLEITKLDIPVLIIQGTTDVQITKEDSDLLAAAKPDAEYVTIEGMNHVLKDAPPGRIAQLATYYKPDIALKEGLIEAIVRFIEE